MSINEYLFGKWDENLLGNDLRRLNDVYRVIMLQNQPKKLNQDFSELEKKIGNFGLSIQVLQNRY